MLLKVSSSSDHFPLVTVRVGVYNHAPYAAECLDSIVNTKYPNMELIITNDASPDDSDHVINEWIAKHSELDITYIRHEHNMGNTKSLNEAIKRMKGDYFCPIASDDLMLPNSIVDRLSYLQNNPHKLAVFGDCHVIDQDSRLIHYSGIEERLARRGMRKRFLKIDRLIPYSIVFNWAVPGPVFMCRREAFEVVGLYDETIMVEDWDMYLRLAAIGKLGFFDGYVAKYRIHGKNAIFTMGAAVSKGKAYTAGKNMKNFAGLKWLHLLALYLKGRFSSSRSVKQKGLLFLMAGALLVLTHTMYWPVKWYLWGLQKILSAQTHSVNATEAGELP